MSQNDKYYRELVELLDEHLDTATPEGRFAYYGYAFAFFDMQLITNKQFYTLADRIDLPADAIDALDL